MRAEGTHRIVLASLLSTILVVGGALGFVALRKPRAERTSADRPALSAFYAAKDGDAAIAALDEAVRAAPANAHLYELRGATLQSLGRDAAAVRDFQEAVRLDPGNTSAWHELIGLQDWHGAHDRTVAARLYRDRVLSAAPSSATHHRNFARLLDAAGDGRDAEREFGTAVALAPAEASYYLEFASYLQQRGPEGRTAAIALLDRALARTVTDRGAIGAALGRLAFTQQDYGRAATAYAEAAKASPHVAEYREMASEAARRTRTAR